MPGPGAASGEIMEQYSAIHLGRRIRHVGRLAQIANILAKHGFWSVLEAANIGSSLTPEQRKVAEEISREESKQGQDVGFSSGDIELARPRRVREAIEELGPAFVKLGQLLASREDILPDAYIKELRKLHKDVVTLPFEIIQRVLREELGEEGLAQFAEISSTPLAAGSIGQVHPAVLKSGEKVVIKIQRPNIAEQIRIDLGLMEVLAGMLERYIPEFRSARPKVTVEEFMHAMEGELDFVREAGNLTKIAQNFADNQFLILPEVNWDLTTTKVLTQTFVEGYALADKQGLVQAGLDPEVLVDRGLNIFLQMVFVDGQYHGDLHEGNLLAAEGNRIAMIDFGLTVRIGRVNRENLAGLLMALVEEDYESMVSHFVELADPSPSFNIVAFEEAVANELSPFIGLKLAKVRTGKMLWRLAKLSAKYGAPLPRPLILFFRTLAAFEGIGSRLTPDFDIINSCRAFSDKLVKKMYSKEAIKRQGLLIGRDLANLARFAPRQVRGLISQIVSGDLQINIASREVQFAANSLDRSVSRLAVSVIVAALIIGSSILVMARVGEEYHNVSTLGLAGFATAGILGLYIVYSIVRGGGKF